MKDNFVNLYKDGDTFGIESSCDDENIFLDEVTREISELIENGKFKDDWWFQLRGWMPHIIEVHSILKGGNSLNGVVGSGDIQPKNFVAGSR